MFGRSWERIDGKVLAESVDTQRPSSNGQWYTRMKYVVEYRTPEGKNERIELKETEKFGAKVMAPLARGSEAPLLVDQKSGKVRFDIDDPRINLKARRERGKKRDDDDFNRALKG